MDKEKLIYKVTQDTNEIFTRLFDHRPFLNGEVQNFLREFEEKKGSRDIEALLKSREKLTDLNTVFGTVNNTHIKESIGNLVQSIQETTKTIEDTSLPKVKETTESLEKEAVRQKKWIEFLDQNTADLAAVDNLVKEKELELRKHYQDLEQKLKISNS